VISPWPIIHQWSIEQLAEYPRNRRKNEQPSRSPAPVDPPVLLPAIRFRRISVVPWTIANTVPPNQSIATNAAQAVTATMTYGSTTSGNTSNLWTMLVEQLN